VISGKKFNKSGTPFRTQRLLKIPWFKGALPGAEDERNTLLE
jgi:hypothetical protein